ncbi:MAG: OmpA family protein [Deltaproteobacteria bacterium]|nr:OmpA family protein [Deltaproteobacteria bacterium]
MLTRRNLALGVIAVLVVSSLSGCAAWQNTSRTTKGAVLGTAGGAGAGAAIGAIVGGGKGAGKGAAIGAVVGGLAGTGIGYYMEQQAKEMEAVLAEQDRLRRRQDQLDIELSSDVLFESGKAYLQPGARDKLARFAGVLNRYPESRVAVVGHTDNRGSDELNYSLSKQRADAVASVFSASGVSPSRMTTLGEGKSRPVATNETPEGRAQNRRVDVHVMPADQAGSPAGAGSEPY